jgi:hypothetical protein
MARHNSNEAGPSIAVSSTIEPNISSVASGQAPGPQHASAPLLDLKVTAELRPVTVFHEPINTRAGYIKRIHVQAAVASRHG